MAKRRGQSRRDYPRMARVNVLLREILADELERLDDDRLVNVTFTAVDCETDLKRALVSYDSLDGAESDEEVKEALGELRWRFQAAIGRQARLKNTPELRFEPDEVIRGAERIDQVLRSIPPTPAAGADDGAED